jgi:cobalt/nickel transport protein
MTTPRILLVLASLLLAGAPRSQAHEIKVLASQLAMEQPGGKTTVYLAWGHRLPVDDLIDAASVERYDLVSPGGTATALKKDGLSLQTNVVELKDAGVHQVLVARKPSVFTYVFDGEGGRALKRGPKTAVKEGKVDYGTRSVQTAKALIVVGPAPREPVKPAGLPVEIVPLDGPAAWADGATLRFQVLLEGKPLAGAELTARYVGYKPDNAWCYATTTGRDGVATVRAAPAGTWVLKVSAKRLTNGATRAEYDFESFTTTLTLEIRP